jgi:GH15 family glucan-1,4-alpha-glucosidase
MTTGRRTEGYVPIEDYALLGDGRTIALVAGDGRVDWWPVPTLDSPPAFAAVLDPENGGYLDLRPAADEFTTTRRYVPGTNVLETTFRTDTGSVRVTDALSVGAAGPLPWGELARRVEGVDGTVQMIWTVRPGTRFDSCQPWTETNDRTVSVHLGDQHFAVLTFDVGDPTVTGEQVSGEFSSAPGSRSLLVVTSTDAEPLFLPDRADLDHHLDRSIARWKEWSEWIRYDGSWTEAVTRSALTLKLLLFAPTGAIAAAPTTSLPERLGGDKNWDYRYMWVRDSSYTVDALMELGLHEEVQSAVSFLLSAIRKTAPNLHVFYTLDGEVPDEHTELDSAGYRGSQPVRAGNGAATQTQLGTFGDLFDTMWHYTKNGHLLDPPTGRMLAELADRCCDLWRQPDAGIWELQEAQQYTNSKMGCWVALDRAVRLADTRAIETGHAHRWRHERDRIHAWVDEHCWSTAKSSYTFYAGTEDLDASTLLAGHTGFDRGERLAGTVAAIRTELGDGPLIYRYTGMSDDEGAFVACSFWMVIALAHLGQVAEATALMDDAVGLANDVGLLSEQIDPTGRTMLGNHPQGLSHLALINAATTLAQLNRAAPTTGS